MDALLLLISIKLVPRLFNLRNQKEKGRKRKKGKEGNHKRGEIAVIEQVRLEDVIWDIH